MVHRVDPRVKFIAMAAGVLFIITTPPRAYPSFVIYALTVLSLLTVARVPLAFAGTRLLLTMPFVLAIGAFIPFIREGKIAGSYSLGSWRLAVTDNGLLSDDLMRMQRAERARFQPWDWGDLNPGPRTT